MDSINSKTLYDEDLKLFNVEIRESGKGHIVVVTDDQGEPIRYPIRLSKFQEKPQFWGQREKKFEKQTIQKTKLISHHHSLFMDFLKELNRQLRCQDMKNQKGKKYKIKKKGNWKKCSGSLLSKLYLKAYKIVLEGWIISFCI